jgi:hypothetical protein
MDKKLFAAAAGLILSFAFLPLAASAACSQVSGKTYYTDRVSFFKDSACRQEMAASEMNSSASGVSAAAGYISTGNNNCRYSLAKKQYTDSVSFFTDYKCTVEALNDEAVPAPAAAPAAATGQTQATVQTAAAGAAAVQADQRIDALERKVNSLMSIMAQILALLARK